MPPPPRLEKRPNTAYYLGQALARGCLGPSIIVNIVRLCALVYVIPQLVLLLNDQPAATKAGIGVAVFFATFLVRPRLPQLAAASERWSEKERKLAFAVETAYLSGASTTQAATNTLGEIPSIDYGTTTEGRPVCIDQELRRAHQAITGASGTGKSLFIATQAGQSALTNKSLVVIDPHEELAATIITSAAHVLAERGVIMLWPHNPINLLYPWNPLTTGPERPAWKVADSIVGAFKRVWQLTDANTYIIETVQHTILALAGAGWTLLEGTRFLTDERFRQYVSERANIPQVTLWVKNFNALTPRDRLDKVAPTLARLNRFQMNPYLKQMIGAGVTDPKYIRARRRAGQINIDGLELGEAINRGHHIFAVLPRETMGEDQYLAAGLVQAILLEAMYRRKANDPAMPETEAYLDEAPAYANQQGLGKLLAEARKYRFNAVVAMQGIHQAEDALQDELLTNTAIKVVFGTDHRGEAENAAAMLFPFDPNQIKIDARQRVRSPHGGEHRDMGTFQTYSPVEQREFHTSEILQLKKRNYILKVRGSGEPMQVITPNYAARYNLPQALRIAHRRRVAKLINPVLVNDEIAWRETWLEAGGYDDPRNEAPLPTFGGVPHAHAPITTLYVDERTAPEEQPVLSFGGDTEAEAEHDTQQVAHASIEIATSLLRKGDDEQCSGDVVVETCESDCSPDEPTNPQMAGLPTSFGFGADDD